MVDEGRPTLDTDPKGREQGLFTLAGRVTRWDALARELTIGGRVLEVAATVLLVGDALATATVIVSGYQPPDPSGRWIVTHLRLG